MAKRKTVFLVGGLILIGGVIPLMFYYFVLGNVPNVQAEEALFQLNQSPDQYALVDVRPGSEFQESHLDGAIHWPLAEISKLSSIQDVPEIFLEKRLILICNAGFMSAEAARQLQRIGLEKVSNVQGGMQEWGKAAALSPNLEYTSYVSDGAASGPAFQELSLIAQFIPILSGFVIKPSHMLISLMMILILWKSSNSGDLKILAWGLGLLLFGEVFCAVNFLFFNDGSWFSDYLHNYGMMLGFGFILYAMLDGLDKRVFGLSSPKKPCSMIALCEKCVKNAEVSCRLQNIYLWACVLLALIALIPLLVPVHANSYVTEIFGTLHQYSKDTIFQYYEFRVIPVYAAGCFLAAFIWQKTKPQEILPEGSRLFFSGGLGGLFFSIFRLLLGSAFEWQLHFSDFWEEATEFMLVGIVAYVLWQFRSKLFPDGMALLPKRWVG